MILIYLNDAIFFGCWLLAFGYWRMSDVLYCSFKNEIFVLAFNYKTPLFGRSDTRPLLRRGDNQIGIFSLLYSANCFVISTAGRNLFRFIINVLRKHVIVTTGRIENRRSQISFKQKNKNRTLKFG